LGNLVVGVLASSLGVEPGGLQVSVRRRGDPHVGPGRRNLQRRNPRQPLRVGHSLALGVAIREPVAPPLAPQPGLAAMHVHEVLDVHVDVALGPLRVASSDRRPSARKPPRLVFG